MILDYNQCQNPDLTENHSFAPTLAGLFCLLGMNSLVGTANLKEFVVRHTFFCKLFGGDPVTLDALQVFQGTTASHAFPIETRAQYVKRIATQSAREIAQEIDEESKVVPQPA